MASIGFGGRDDGGVGERESWIEVDEDVLLDGGGDLVDA
jgi:hypothetical protein